MLSISDSPEYCELFLATFMSLLMCGIVLAGIVVVVVYGSGYYGVENEWLTYLLIFLLVMCLLSICMWWRIEYDEICENADFWAKNKDTLCTPPPLHNESVI